MSFNKKIKNIIGDVKWEDLDHKKVYLALAALVAVIVLVVVLIVGAVSGKDEKPQETESSVPVSEEAISEEVVDENPLEVDAYEEINRLMLVYFHGISTGDIPMVEEAVDVLTDEEIQAIEKKKDYVESYNDITCYTKKGLEEDSFVVFASYEMKIYNIETPAPGIMALYVVKDDNGDYRIFNGEASEELKNYVLELATEEEVAAVIADVDARYQQLIEEDEDLGKFAQIMLESQQKAEEEDREMAEAPSEGDAKELEEPITTKVNDGIRIREGRSTETRMLATIVTGTEVKVYASYEDGWSKIEYSGTKGYCKTEFLESTEGVPTLSVEPEEAETEEEEETTEETTSENAEVVSVNKEMQFKETVRIRKERSAESERIGTGYENNLVKVIENYNDGWSKIDYNGTIGYCMTQYLEEAH